MSSHNYPPPTGQPRWEPLRAAPLAPRQAVSEYHTHSFPQSEKYPVTPMSPLPQNANLPKPLDWGKMEMSTPLDYGTQHQEAPRPPPSGQVGYGQQMPTPQPSRPAPPGPPINLGQLGKQIHEAAKDNPIRNTPSAAPAIQVQPAHNSNGPYAQNELRNPPSHYRPRPADQPADMYSPWYEPRMGLADFGRFYVEWNPYKPNEARWASDIRMKIQNDGPQGTMLKIRGPFPHGDTVSLIDTGTCSDVYECSIMGQRNFQQWSFIWNELYTEAMDTRLHVTPAARATLKPAEFCKDRSEYLKLRTGHGTERGHRISKWARQLQPAAPAMAMGQGQPPQGQGPSQGGLYHPAHTQAQGNAGYPPQSSGAPQQSSPHLPPIAGYQRPPSGPPQTSAPPPTSSGRGHDQPPTGTPGFPPPQSGPTGYAAPPSAQGNSSYPHLPPPTPTNPGYSHHRTPAPGFTPALPGYPRPTSAQGNGGYSLPPPPSAHPFPTQPARGYGQPPTGTSRFSQPPPPGYQAQGPPAPGAFTGLPSISSFPDVPPTPQMSNNHLGPPSNSQWGR